MFIRHLLISAIVLGAILVPASFADQILVNNPSFETPPVGGFSSCGAGCQYDVGPISGWSNSGTSGQFIPNSAYFNSVPDGSIIAYTNDNPITQTLGLTVQSGVTYTLSVSLGLRGYSSVFDGAADLLINGNTYAAVGVTPTPGNWSVFTATYVAKPSDLGDAITIELKSLGNPNEQADFDNVVMTDSLNSPEPGYIGVVAIALLGLFVHRRYKNKPVKQLS